MAAHSLYRRYRPQRFDGIVGQQHVVTALRNAVAAGTEGHAYLFSGPRGTGKTSTARILAKALNCPDVDAGEPCGVCASCRSIEEGTSYDLFELDAASNNGVAEMRDLVSRAAVGSPGRTKVYILDEVHMLSTGASNALLKTLEEPPDHVCFVLATTDPQKVLPTIRSRTQHFDFNLLTSEELTEHVRWVVADAGLSVDEAAIAHVVRLGKGSARDTLSALDQVVAAGGVVERDEPVSELVAAIVERDQGRALSSVAAAIAQGRDPRVLADALLSSLRDAFLSNVGGQLDHLSGADREEIRSLAEGVGTVTLTRALEAVGSAIIEMRQAPDPRVPLEVALLRVCDPAVDNSLSSIVERLERLERLGRSAAPAQAASAAAPPPAAPTPPAPAPPASTPPASTPPAPPKRARPAGDAPPPAVSSPPEPPASPGPTAQPGATDAPAVALAAPAGDLPTREELTIAMGDAVLAKLKQGTKAIYANGRFAAVIDGVAVFAFENRPTLDHAERRRSEVEEALAAHFGRRVPVRLAVESEVAHLGASAARAADAPAAAKPSGSRRSPSERPDAPAHADARVDPGDDGDDDEAVDPAELTDADDAPSGGVARLTEAFPGAVIVEEDP